MEISKLSFDKSCSISSEIYGLLHSSSFNTSMNGTDCKLVNLMLKTMHFLIKNFILHLNKVPMNADYQKVLPQIFISR